MNSFRNVKFLPTCTYMKVTNFRAQMEHNFIERNKKKKIKEYFHKWPKNVPDILKNAIHYELTNIFVL